MLCDQKTQRKSYIFASFDMIKDQRPTHDFRRKVCCVRQKGKRKKQENEQTKAGPIAERSNSLYRGWGDPGLNVGEMAN